MWMDAASQLREDVCELHSVNPSSLLVLTSTLGKLIKYDNDAIILVSEESLCDSVDYTVIPISIIVNINELQIKGGLKK